MNVMIYIDFSITRGNETQSIFKFSNYHISTSIMAHSPASISPLSHLPLLHSQLPLHRRALNDAAIHHCKCFLHLRVSQILSCLKRPALWRPVPGLCCPGAKRHKRSVVSVFPAGIFRVSW